MDSMDSAVSETLAGFNINNDLNVLDHLGDQLKDMDRRRRRELDTQQSRIDGLKRQLATQNRMLEQLRTSEKLKQAKKDLMVSEDEMFKVANALTASNMEVNSLKLTYNQDLKRLDELDQQLQTLRDRSDDADLVESVDRAKMIKVKLYESLGVKGDPEHKQVLVLNKGANKTRVLKLDDRYSAYFVSNYVWDNL